MVKKGEIDEIAINGKNSFKKNMKFNPDVRIAITYHTKKKIDDYFKFNFIFAKKN